VTEFDDYGEVIAVVGEVLKRSQALNPDCCGNDAWRGRLCRYHQGIEDGAEMAMLVLRSRK
jgi:hypothetical protein